MSTLKAVRTGASGTVEVVERERPTAGPRDAVVRIRACGICGTDTFFVISSGMIRPDGDAVPVTLGHEPAGEVVEVGDQVVGPAVGDHVVINPMIVGAARLGLRQGRGVRGRADRARRHDLARAPGRPAGHRRRPPDRPTEGGAGGRRRRRHRLLGRGRHAAPHRAARHGRQRPGGTRVGTDVYLAAGAPQVLEITQASAKWGARLVIVAVHKKPVDISGILRSELTIIGSVGYPDELFQATPALAANRERLSTVISHRVPFSDVPSAYDLAITPGAADRVVVTFDD
jgi:(R,R)-butanediol dehydrogenase / meso-butanediol dehydrogenase / diacetyl reductase